MVSRVPLGSAFLIAGMFWQARRLRDIQAVPWLTRAWLLHPEKPKAARLPYATNSLQCMLALMPLADDGRAAIEAARTPWSLLGRLADSPLPQPPNPSVRCLTSVGPPAGYANHDEPGNQIPHISALIEDHSRTMMAS